MEGKTLNKLVCFSRLTKTYSTKANIELASFWQALFPKLYDNKDLKFAVNRVSGTFHEGEVIGIIGHNGAGKSTLLNMITGTTEPTSGELDVLAPVSAILTLGLGLREEASGRENIYIDGEIRGKSRRDVDSYIDEVIDFSDLGDDIERPLRTYSTGMKSRLAFSMLVTVMPEILIIDEALGAGDLNFSRKAAKKIKEICKRGKLVIIVTHAMEVIRDMCSRCIWMEQGEVKEDGLPDIVTKKYTDHVRKNDEENLRKNIPVNSELRLFQNGEQRHILELGSAIEFKIKGGYPDVKSFEFYRLDGVPVWKVDVVPCSNFIKTVDGRYKLMRSYLGKGRYIVKSILTSGQVLQQYFEVRSDRLFIGGVPQFNLSASIEFKIKD